MNTEIKFRNFVELTKYFSDETKCAEHLAQLRWGGTPACVHCGSLKVYKCKGAKNYICGEKGCLKRFSVTTGTFFDNTKLPLSKIFIAMYLCFSHKKGVSSHQLARDLGITQKSAWHLLHRIRVLVKGQTGEAQLKNMVEIDESFVGGKEKNRHASKRQFKQGQGAIGRASIEDKATVVGAVERNGRVIAKYIPNARQEHIEPFIKDNVRPGARIITDEYYAYRNVHDFFRHDRINHSLKVYVQGDIHTNTIENFWSVLKRGIYGTYHQVSRKHIQQYLNEFSFKYSTRDLTEQQRFDTALSLCNGRLKYQTLIGKEVKNEK